MGDGCQVKIHLRVDIGEMEYETNCVFLHLLAS